MDPLGERDPQEVGGFRLVGRLGSGGMGVVYLAEAADGGRVALKLVHESLAGESAFRRRFAREIAAVSRIESPYVASVVASDATATRPWMATRYIEGRTLLAAVEASGPLPPAQLRTMIVGVAHALADIHSADVVHRDLKPSNVMLTADCPVVLDFGIAHARDASSITATGMTSGSAGYMSPEQAVGRDVTPASDVFSLGALICYAATGRLAFGAGSTDALVYRVVHEEPDLTNLSDPGTAALVRACLSKDPAERPHPLRVARIARGQDAPPLPPPSGVGEEEPTTIRPLDMDVPAPASATSGWRRRFSGRVVAVALLVVAIAGTAMTTWAVQQGAGAAAAPDGPAGQAARPSAPASPEAGPGPAVTTATSSPFPSAATSGGKGGVEGPSSGVDTLPQLPPSGGDGKPGGTNPDREEGPAAGGSESSGGGPDENPPPPATSKQHCLDASKAGSLVLNPENAGGPNFVPDGCNAIYLRLTAVEYITYAKVCMETPSGATQRCGTWVFLEDAGAWNHLISGVAPGDRYVLHMKADGPETVEFLFSAS
jgi:hypothetical protein